MNGLDVQNCSDVILHLILLVQGSKAKVHRSVHHLQHCACVSHDFRISLIRLKNSFQSCHATDFFIFLCRGQSIEATARGLGLRAVLKYSGHVNLTETMHLHSDAGGATCDAKQKQRSKGQKGSGSRSDADSQC